MIIIESKIIHYIISKLFDVDAITLYPFIFVDKYESHIILNHEMIHGAQYKELFIIGFLILYVYDFMVGIIKFRNFNKAYFNIRLEREAYINADNLEYLSYRKKYAWRFL